MDNDQHSRLTSQLEDYNYHFSQSCRFTAPYHQCSHDNYAFHSGRNGGYNLQPPRLVPLAVPPRHLSHQSYSGQDSGGAHPGFSTVNDAFEFGPDAIRNGLALVHDQNVDNLAFGIHTPPADGVIPITSDQNWTPNNAYNLPSLDPLFTTHAAFAKVKDNFELSAGVFDLNFASALDNGVPNFQLPTLIPQAAVQPSNIGAANPGQPSGLLYAVVLGNGPFFCSEPGCNATYPRLGDCCRHLKKHNGPFFYCNQPGCDMKFYRNDKLQDHLKKGHGIVVTAAASRRRQRRAPN